MSATKFAYVVVGAGIVGSWTAKELAKHGSVLLMEQFPLPHTRGSSHGQSRLIRSGYAEPFFTEMMPHAFQMWQEAMDETKVKLIQKTGVLTLSNSKDNKDFDDFVASMRKFCPQYLKVLTAKDVENKFPRTLKFSENSRFVMDTSGGVVFAQKSVNTIQHWFKNSGGTIWDSCTVKKIEPVSSEKVIVSSSKGEVHAKYVVVCAGPWTKELLKEFVPSLPLQPTAIKVYYWKEKETGAYSAASGFPAFLSFTEPHIYGLPSIEYPGLMKICVHGGVPAEPEARDLAPTSQELENKLKNYVKEHFPLLESEPAIVETCMYTMTPDEVFVIDALPGHNNVAIGAGFSGTGFKTSPVVGRLLSQLVRGEKPFLSLEPFRISRFAAT